MNSRRRRDDAGKPRRRWQRPNAEQRHPARPGVSSLAVALTLVRNLPVSAASGLVRVGATTYVVADDELHLLILPDDGEPQTLRLLAGDLPEDPRARKAIKPDFEALCRWHDGLLALGSGSTAMRHRGCLIRPVPGDLARTTVRELDLAPLHAHLASRVPALNLEGAAVASDPLLGDALLLLQRGNGRGNRSAVVRLDAAAVARALADDNPWDASLVRDVQFIELGDRAGAPLAFTDASPLPDGSLVFLAAAEDTPDTYRDGQLTGVAIGRLAPDLTLAWLADVPGAPKLEGIHAELTDDTLHLWLVADPDDRNIPAPLYTATLHATTGAWLTPRTTAD